MKTRKRRRAPETWKANVRKSKTERGEQSISSKNKVVPAKHIKNLKDCSNCIYKCAAIISTEERQELFKDFYSLDRQAKRTFITANCEVCIPERRRKGKKAENSKKKQTCKYFFKIKDKKVQVCKKYFLSTLDVSQKTI